MKYFQLFTEKPNMEFMQSLLRCFNIESFEDPKSFCKDDLVDWDTVTKIEDLIPELIIYYLPCKSQIYLTEINEKRCITILSQFLKLFDYKLCRKEHVIKRRKKIFYTIMENKLCQIRISQERAEVDFD